MSRTLCYALLALVSPLVCASDASAIDIQTPVGAVLTPIDELTEPLGDPTMPDLTYDALTGEVTLDGSELPGSVLTSYLLKTDGGFIEENFTPFMFALTTQLDTSLGEGPSFGGIAGISSIGNVFPTGMDLAELMEFLTETSATGTFGTGVTSWEPFVIIGQTNPPAVPEPSTYAQALIGLASLGFYGWRRKRA